MHGSHYVEGGAPSFARAEQWAVQDRVKCSLVAGQRYVEISHTPLV